MDTRSIKIHNCKVLKAILIILSVVFFIGTYFYGQTLFAFYLDNWNEQGIFALKASDSVLSNGTSEYAKKIRTETGNARLLASEYKSDEYVESGEGWAYKEEKIKEKYENNCEAEILEEKKNWIETQYNYNETLEIYEYPNYGNQSVIIDFSSEDQIAADERYITIGDFNVFGLTKRANGYYYKGFPLKYANIDEDAIREQLELEMRQEIATEKAAYKSTYKEIKEELSSLKNYKYFLKNNYTGLFYTNMDGVKTVEEAKEKYKTDTEYYASIINGDFETSKLLDDSVLNSSTWFYSSEDEINYVNDSSDKFEYCFGKLDPEQYDMVVYTRTTNVDKMPADSFTQIYNKWQYQADNLDQNRNLFIISVLGLFLSMIVLAKISGEMNEDGTLKDARIDKIPNTIHFILSWVFILCFTLLPMVIYMDGVTNWVFSPSLGVALFSAPAVLFFDECLMSTARQAVNRKYWKNTITYRLIIKNWPAIKKWSNSGIEKITHDDIKKNIFLAFIAYVVLMCIFSAIPFVGAILGIVLSALAFLYVRKLSTGLDAISSALTKAEKGDYDFSVDVDSMPIALQAMGENVNSLTNGFNTAVEDKLKNERTKTELITNVSHDLKTPLTSIITYTDLLKNCDIENEQAKEYIDVLDDKAHRLKKLVEDLVEASKASSGNVTLNMVEINVNELVDQIYGEYEDDLKEWSLDLKMTFPKEAVSVVADGQKTYRILDNLFSNVKKYALPGSRVYLNVSKDLTYGIIEMKNVSRDEMNFDIERLTDRFVRGDDSRSTEGAGLGLSIAKSLTEIQDGHFDISVDGDLFKVTIKLPLAK